MPVDVYIIHAQCQRGHIGSLPEWLNESDPRSAKEQFDHHYRHGGGWFPMSGAKVTTEKKLHLPLDGIDLPPLAMMMLREEVIFIYELGIVGILQKDGTSEVARMD